MSADVNLPRTPITPTQRLALQAVRERTDAWLTDYPQTKPDYEDRGAVIAALARARACFLMLAEALPESGS